LYESYFIAMKKMLFTLASNLESRSKYFCFFELLLCSGVCFILSLCCKSLLQVPPGSQFLHTPPALRATIARAIIFVFFGPVLISFAGWESAPALIQLPVSRSCFSCAEPWVFRPKGFCPCSCFQVLP
jgi:hypothetical protein